MDEEKEFERLRKEYRKRFGKNIVFCAVGGPDEEPIDIIRRCLETGKPYEMPDAPEGCKI